MRLMEFVAGARKFCVALAAALAVTATALADSTVTTSEWVQIAAAFLGAYGVYQVTNVKKGE